MDKRIVRNELKTGPGLGVDLEVLIPRLEDAIASVRDRGADEKQIDWSEFAECPNQAVPALAVAAMRAFLRGESLKERVVRAIEDRRKEGVL